MKPLLLMHVMPSSVVARRDLTLDLAAVDGSMLPLVGGKAANLGELIRAGFPVPPGVCVTTEAYGQVAASAAIDFDALDTAKGEDVQRVARIEERILRTRK